MNADRFAALLSQQTSVAKKVFAATPIQEAWTPQQILGELKRQGRKIQIATLNGCLASMKATGLVMEVSKNTWTQVPPAMAESLEDEQEQHYHTIPVIKEQPIVAQESKEVVSLPDRVVALSGRARSISESMMAFALELEEVALELEAEHQKHGIELSKYTQLKALLKSLD